MEITFIFLSRKECKSDSALVLNINIENIFCDMEYIVYLVICIR